MDPITDIFRTMHVTAIGLHRLEATAPWGIKQEQQTDEIVTPADKKMSPTDLVHFAMLSRGNCWLTVEGTREPIPLTGGDCFLLARDSSIVLRDSPRTSPSLSFREVGATANNNVIHHGGGGAPTTIVCGAFSFDRTSLKPVTQLLPSFILMKADQARTLALHITMQALASEMAEQAPGSGVVASRLAEILFIHVLRAYIASGPERSKGWLRAVFDPQMGTALSAIHGKVNTPWTVESLAEATGMSRSAFAARFKELLGQTPLEYVTQWRMQKAMQLLEQRDKKLIDVARSVGYESDAASVRRSSELLGLTLVNTSNVVLKAMVLRNDGRFLDGLRATDFRPQASRDGLASFSQGTSGGEQSFREHPGVTRLGSADASFASTAESVPEGSDFIHGRYLLVDVCGFSGHARRSMRA